MCAVIALKRPNKERLYRLHSLPLRRAPIVGVLAGAVGGEPNIIAKAKGYACARCCNANSSRKETTAPIQFLQGKKHGSNAKHCTNYLLLLQCGPGSVQKELPSEKRPSFTSLSHQRLHPNHRTMFCMSRAERQGRTQCVLS